MLRDGEVIAHAAKTHFTVKGLAPMRDYVFTVKARSLAGGAAGSSNPLPLRTLVKEAVVSVLDHGAVGDGATLNTKRCNPRSMRARQEAST